MTTLTALPVRRSIRLSALLLTTMVLLSLPAAAQQWSVQQSQEWYEKQPWLVGCNFLPSTAINQIEMWQTSTWDKATIERELTWAQQLGFNSVRVYLHDVVYAHERQAFLDHIDRFLNICQQRGIRPILVLFDDCHYAKPEIGDQPDPIPGVHNSGWKQSPGYDITLAYERGELPDSEVKRLKDYVTTVLTHFKDDPRILAWDLYNEPGGSRSQSLRLLQDTWQWAWQVRPSQPLTAGVRGTSLPAARKLNAKNADIYSFHDYSSPKSFAKSVAEAIEQADGRPVFCTEYMARPKGSTFKACLPVFKKHKIACYNWGLVDGKSGTKWSWGTRSIGAGDAVPTPKRDPANAPSDPPLWFHDIFHPDGTPYIEAETDFIRRTLRDE
ncbi:cellulase family glycosylhydrolase [Aeoliella mucimassa]|uniref:Sugar-binding cellulase-like protein n=1 Tax=Aeoliella mucimassa TaxID=2527972 RepID=A0A518AU50_9BACT|nr:cellulase family glycosylhydrolase [Aeoliella mucimassa]QDU58259.1 Sugar-binding cellulase-like protein [Aeoliella mucimassa]